MKLRTKIFLSFSILATVPLIFFTAFCYHRYTQTTNERIEIISSNLFENAQSTLNSTLNRIRQTASTFYFYYNDGTSIINDLKNFKNPNTPPNTYEYFTLSQNFKRTCQNLLYSDEDLYGIYIFTPSGYVFNCTNGENGNILPNYDFITADWYQETIASDKVLYVSNNSIHDCFTGNKQTIFFTQCLKDVYSHDIVGVLMLDYSSDIFNLTTINTIPDMTLLSVENMINGDILYSCLYKTSFTFH